MTGSLETLKAFVAKHGRALPFEPRPGVVVLGAGKGGVGTSTVAALLAVAAAARGIHTLLVDANDAVGSVHLMLGIPDGGPGIGSLAGKRTAEDLVLRVTPTLDLIPGGIDQGEAPETVTAGQKVVAYRKVSGLYERYELTIVDAGARLDGLLGVLGAGAERLLAVTAADRISLAGSYALFKVVGQRQPELPVEVLINGRGEPQARSVFRIVETAATRFLGIPVSFAGGIPEDPTIRNAVANGTSLAIEEGSSPARTAVSAVLDRILFQQQALVATGTASVLSIDRGL